MSFQSYGKFWLATKENLEDVLLIEQVAKHLEPTRDRSKAHRVISSLYARYIILTNNLSDIYDQALGVEKRNDVEKMYLSASKRLLELQDELRKVEMSEFVYVDETLMELKVTTKDIEFLRPFYFPQERSPEIQMLVDRPKKTKFLMIKEPPQGGRRMTVEEQEIKRMHDNLVNSVNLIKLHERARQARAIKRKYENDPVKFRLERNPSYSEISPYKFYHDVNTIPKHKVRRTVFINDFYPKRKNLEKFNYYQPPELVTTKSGHRISISAPILEFSEDEFDDSVAKQRKLSLKLEAEKVQQIKDNVEKKNSLAAWKILKYHRIFNDKKLKNARNVQSMAFCGMIHPEPNYEKIKIQQGNEDARERRRRRKFEFDARFKKAVDDENARIVKLKTPYIMEDISDFIRAWFKEFYDGVGELDRYPEVFEGGSILVIRGETKTVEEYKDWLERKKRDADKTKEDKAKEKAEALKLKEETKIRKKKLADIARKKLREQKLLDKTLGQEWNFTEKKFRTKNILDLEQSWQEYELQWRFIDELADKDELPNKDWIALNKIAALHVELHPIVDEFMRLEHDLLRRAIFEHRLIKLKNKKKKPKYKPQAPKKQRKQKKPKEAKKSEFIDVFAAQSFEDCLVELENLKIIRKYPQRQLEDFIGDLNFAAFEQRLNHQDPVPFYGEIRDALRACILGMGPLALPKPKSVCIAGPNNCGKKMLVEALASEMDAVILDLSPAKLITVEDMPFFVEMILQMAKKLQPTILFIDGAHKPFYKKVPAAEKYLDPTKLGKYLLKNIVKRIQREDLIMLIGTTSEPWNGQLGKMKKCYERSFLLQPQADFSTLCLIWHKGIQKYHSAPKIFEVQPMAQVLKGYSTGDILERVDMVLNFRRRLAFSRNPLKPNEFLETFLMGPSAIAPMQPKERRKFNNWYLSVNKLAKQRNNYIRNIQAETNGTERS